MSRVPRMLASLSIKAVNAFVNLFLVVVMLAFVGVGAYSLWDTHNIEAEADSSKWHPYKPSAKNTVSFDELRAQNSDVVAWLGIYGTNIDYPVMYNENETIYLNHDPLGNFSLSGSLFFDSRTKPDFSSFPTVIYGHHMERNKMFGQLDAYADEDFFRSHRYGNYFYNGKDYGVEIIGVVQSDAYDSKVYRNNVPQSQRIEYIEGLRSIFLYSNDVSLDENSRILLLSTCASDSTNGRTIVVAKVSDDTFVSSFIDWPNTGSGVEDTRGWFGLPWLFWNLLIFVCVVGSLFAIYQYRKQGKDDEEGLLS
ncbi:MAG: class B sortase [Actinomycetaceae bacterium]|nr:class B sortase [Actinomycetaceae bacterium]